MPELPEVEIVARQLDAWFTGKAVTVEVYDGAAIRSKLSSKPSDVAAGGEASLHAAVGVAEKPVRHGKRIGWPFGEQAVLVHLGMTGRFQQGEKTGSSRIRFGEDVYFNDRRRFGCVTVVPRSEMDATLRKGHGPDALLERLDGAGLKAVLTGRRAIKVALMDQGKIAGLGNIHAAEALWRAKIDPRTPCNKVEAWEALAVAIVQQLEETLVQEESGELVYVTDGGPNRFSVYGREGEPCPVCAGQISSIAQSGRTTYFCAGCQG